MAKHEAVAAYEKYSEDGSTDQDECPRCGPGTFLAEHDDRRTCGRCGYAEIDK